MYFCIKRHTLLSRDIWSVYLTIKMFYNPALTFLYLLIYWELQNWKLPKLLSLLEGPQLKNNNIMEKLWVKLRTQGIKCQGTLLSPDLWGRWQGSMNRTYTEKVLLELPGTWWVRDGEWLSETPLCRTQLMVPTDPWTSFIPCFLTPNRKQIRSKKSNHDWMRNQKVAICLIELEGLNTCSEYSIRISRAAINE